MAAEVHVLDHPLIQHKLTLMRRKETSTTNFRRLLNEIGSLMAYEVTRSMPMHEIMPSLVGSEMCIRDRVSTSMSCIGMSRVTS